MTEAEKRDTLRWIACWRQAAPELDRIRRAGIRKADTEEFVRGTAGLLDALGSRLPLRSKSGLVEQQAWFRRARP